MPRYSSTFPLASVTLDRCSSVPLHCQLYSGLREAILSAQLAPGLRLPSTRLLAVELNVARNTVVNAFEQLMAEGYLETKTGAGTYVACTLPEDMLYVRHVPHVRPNSAQSPLHFPRPPLPPPLPRINGHTNGHQERTARKPRTLSRRGEIIAAAKPELHSDPSKYPAFQLGIPALDALPFKSWEQLRSRRWRGSPRELLTYGDAEGYQPLRKAIAEYLGAARAVHCEAEQVIIVAGTQQAIDLTARVLIDPGDPVWVEDPGYLGARGALVGAGACLVPVPVDDEGLDVLAGCAICPRARLAYVTPSHQYPLSVTMSFSRRLALLAWASQTGSWIIEDDYDSELRYARRPIAALQGLDRDGRVIYVGTFSKVLFPSLRLAYLVAPPDLVVPLIKARTFADRASPLHDQVVLADFITEGHFARHIRSMRALYAERQAMLVSQAEQHLGGLLEVKPAEAGMHLIGWLPDGTDEEAVSRQAFSYGIEAVGLRAFSMQAVHRPALVLGYSGVAEWEIRHGVRQLARAICTVSHSRSLHMGGG